MHEAKYYKKLEKNEVKCNLCPKFCTIKEDNYGFCNVRKNIKGTLYSMVYGKPACMHIDPIEKKPLYHFRPGTEIFSIGTFGCNLGCKFCQNWEVSQAKRITNFEKTLDQLKYFSPQDIIDETKSYNLNSIAFTYTDPIIFYEYMLDIAKLAKKNKILTVMVSNGNINPEPLKELLPYIDAFNIDLKAFNEDFYKNICIGDLRTTLKTIETISDSKQHLEVTNLLVQGYNDNEEEFEEMCKYLSKLKNPPPLHISRSFPHYQMQDLVPTNIKTMQNFEKIAKKYLKEVHLGNI